MTDIHAHFDRERTITVYRDVIKERDSLKSSELRADYDRIAARLRAIWKHWEGTDTLHQATFGLPTEASSNWGIS